MTNAPERIWIEDEFGDGDDDQWTYGTWDVRNYAGYNVEYVRADIVQALTAERDHAWAMVANADTQMGQSLADHLQATAERDRLREALAMIDAIDPEHHIDGCAQAVVRGLVLRMGETARAALKGETP